MKVKMISRNPDDYYRETTRDIYKAPRNYDPTVHPFEAAREYTRALNATKLERVFAKPFIASLDGHVEGISTLAKHPKSVATIASGAFDGEIFIWNLTTKQRMNRVEAHEGYARGIAFTKSGEKFISIGDDKTVKFWDVAAPKFGEAQRPLNTIVSKTTLTGLTYNWRTEQFATCGEVCQIWEETRNEPIRSFQWGMDTVYWVAFNPIENHLIGTCASDRSIVFYDTREANPVRKVVLTLRSNQLVWNPMESYSYTVANEDYNLYTFDMRYLSSAVHIHKGHTSAVICVDYSPTGLELVSGSYDRTLRIFGCDKSRSRDIYHTKRMQRITDVIWTMDDKYIVNASDEMNLRLWKARASEKLGVLNVREKRTVLYNEALKKKFEDFPQIRKIARHRQVPRHVYGATKQHRIIHLKLKRKETNKRAHSKPGSVPFRSEKRKPIVKEEA